MPKPRCKKKSPKRVLALPDLEQTKSALINSLTSKIGRRTYEHAITEFVDWSDRTSLSISSSHSKRSDAINANATVVRSSDVSVFDSAASQSIITCWRERRNDSGMSLISTADSKLLVFAMFIPAVREILRSDA